MKPNDAMPAGAWRPVPRLPPDDELVRAASEVARALVLPAMRGALDELDPGVRLMCAYHEGWVDAEGNPVQGDGGKLLRPTLALAVARAVGGTSEDAVPAGVAVHMVHAFSLLHDDIIDNDEERRHRATVWKVFGRQNAILAGDALLSLSQSVLAATPRAHATRAVRRIVRDTQRLITGQQDDLDFETRNDVAIEEYLDMAVGKTGALFSSSCALGAELAGAADDIVEALAWCGERLGLAFQIADDVLGIWGDVKVTGKPVFSDLRSRKKTYPVLVALHAEGVGSRRLREIYLAPGQLPVELVAETAVLVEEAGGRDLSELAVTRLVTGVIDVLDGLGISDAGRATLAAIARAMTCRVR